MNSFSFLQSICGLEQACDSSSLRELFSRWDEEIQELILLGLAEYGSRLKDSNAFLNFAEQCAAVLDQSLPKADFERLESKLRQLEPGATRHFRRWGHQPTVSASSIEDKALSDLDLKQICRVFDEILPQQFATDAQDQDPSTFRRPAQKDMALRIAQSLAKDHFLLIDSPTGTGKTLAYMIPALLCAARWEVRIGISTYTRALQEQAFERELPRALKALEELGISTSFRVSLLKGKQNYICWKRLKNAMPGLEDSAESFLAWLALARFALFDQTGDLDRFSMKLPSTLAGKSRIEEALPKLRREITSTRNCCQPGEERKFCSADLAHRRAEKSHVVITNHAFVLAAPDFFKNLIFDEAEHLHAQALSSESLEFRPRHLDRALQELYQEKKGSRAPLNQLQGHGNLLAAEWGLRAPQAIEAWKSTQLALDELQLALQQLEWFRADEQRKRDPKEAYRIFLEFATSPQGELLYSSREKLMQQGAALLQNLENLQDDLTSAPVRGAGRIKTQLARSKEEIEDILGDFALIFPTANGKFAFSNDYFYDFEVDARKNQDWVVARRVLLPDAWLAKYFWPNIQSASLLSATAHLHGGFESSSSFLGLDRVTGKPDASYLETFRAPDPFDYSRVLFTVPTDAPRFDTGFEGREAFLDYVARFLFELCSKVRGRCLVLFTSADDLRKVSSKIRSHFQREQLPLWFQGMEGIPKEQLGQLFRETPNSTLLGLDTFWYGVDFPGGICEYVVLVKLPYGQLDRYHFAQKASLGEAEQRKRIYLPRSLAMFRQGFGRLMRRKEDRGVVFLLDRRSIEPRHRHFFLELPGFPKNDEEEAPLRTLFAPTKRCLEQAYAHMQVEEQLPPTKDQLSASSESD